MRPLRDSSAFAQAFKPIAAGSCSRRKWRMHRKEIQQALTSMRGTGRIRLVPRPSRSRQLRRPKEAGTVAKGESGSAIQADYALVSMLYSMIFRRCLGLAEAAVSH